MNELTLRGIAVFLAIGSLQFASAEKRDALAHTLARMVQVPASFDECHAAVAPPSDLERDHRIEFTIAKDGSPEKVSFPDGSVEWAQELSKCALSRIRFSPATREEEAIATLAFLYIRFHSAGTESAAGVGIEKVGPLITPPLISRRKSTDSCFPRSKAGSMSRFVVKLTVNPDGTASDLVMPLGGEPWHEETARCVVDRITFTPGSRDGQPVMAEATMPIFLSNEGDSVTMSSLRSTNEEVEAAYRACYPPDTLAMTSAFYTFDIGTNGKLMNPKVAKSSGDPLLDDAGKCILGLLEFKPMMRNGQPVRSQATWELPIRPPK